MKNNNLKLIVLLFVLLCSIQLLSGIILFFVKIGFNYEMMIEYFLGNEEKFMIKKEFNGLLETSMFHLVGQVTVAFIIAHFVLFIKDKSPFLIFCGYGVIVFSFLDILAPYLIISFSSYFVWIKLFAFIGFEVTMFYILFMLLISSIKTSKLNKI